MITWLGRKNSKRMKINENNTRIIKDVDTSHGVRRKSPKKPSQFLWCDSGPPMFTINSRLNICLSGVRSHGKNARRHVGTYSVECQGKIGREMHEIPHNTGKMNSLPLASAAGVTCIESSILTT